ncbi:glucokinase [Terrihabitans rhizophilus]|uniref:Glucokinase n=1 Tax=Terrihabitans rhizophilus TaxID=3092662 RepID=A0ABU4RRU0_9HYPH|nr:glucokinase [Terrihabitans sp. PJ23]MDX6807567.1 glucokinase [Terrihabitans sp. PJ23]
MASLDCVLVADVGGTTSRFGIVTRGSLEPRDIHELKGDDFANLQEAIPHYLTLTKSRPARAVIAMAGPVKGGTVHLTNRRGWSFVPEELAQQLGLARVDVMNDFAALAWALPYLPPDELRSIGGVPLDGAATKLVLGPGTGLGVAALARHNGRWTPVPSEGGHIELAAITPREQAVFDRVRSQYGRVSAEAIACGSGIARIDAAIAWIDSGEITEREGKDISDAARAGEARGREVMDIFFDALARFSGDMALAFLAQGGVYIGGGVAVKTIDLMDEARFRANFVAKAPHEKLVAAIGTSLITARYPALTGCAAYAIYES